MFSGSGARRIVYEVFASLSASLLSKGRAIGAFDELIAAITLCHNK